MYRAFLSRACGNRQWIVQELFSLANTLFPATWVFYDGPYPNKAAAEAAANYMNSNS